MDSDILVKLSGFGLWSHSLPEAAQLVAIDMFYSGELGELELDFEPESEHDPQLISALSKTIKEIQSKLTNSISLGNLEAEHVQRDMDERIVEDKTYVAHGSLCEWLEARGVQCGDIMKEWESDEADILGFILDEITKCRIAQTEGRRVLRDIIFADMRGRTASEEEAEKNMARFEAARKEGVDIATVIAEINNEARESTITNFDDLYLSWKDKVDTIDRLTKKIRELQSGGNERPTPVMTVRSRRTLLTIIASVCKRASIDVGSRGASQRIKEATEDVGAPVSADTIKAILGEIPDALEARMK